MIIMVDGEIYSRCIWQQVAVVVLAFACGFLLWIMAATILYDMHHADIIFAQY